MGLPALVISAGGGLEGDSGTWPMDVQASLSHPANSPVTFDLATADDTATAGVDYVPLSTTVTIPAGRVTRVLSVTVKGDTADEGDESFDLLVTNVAGAAFDDGEASCGRRSPTMTTQRSSDCSGPPSTKARAATAI